MTLDDLAKPPRDASTGFISADLNTNGVEKAGYRIAITRDAAPGVRTWHRCRHVQRIHEHSRYLVVTPKAKTEPDARPR